MLIYSQDGDRGGSEELAGGVLWYVEEKRRSDNEGIRLNANQYKERDP